MNSDQTQPRSIFEKLLYMGIATFFLWPFVQLWSIKAIPMVESDVHLRASVELENLLEEALSRPFERISSKNSFKPVKGCEDLGLAGKIENFPHPDFEGMVMTRAQVRWGWFPFTKTLTMEHLRTRNKP
ncbi:MAG: hypothetical protein AB1403_11540 [Candidatus Riflebacteria bacterium]